jgi:hypothetical protein
MLVACSVLVKTLQTLMVATSIGVTGVCPTDLQLRMAPSGSVIDFSRATGESLLDIAGINGLTVQNYTSTHATNAGLNVISSKNILIIQPRIISPGTGGIGILSSDTVEVTGAWISGSSGDGIDITASTNINVHDGACEGNVVTAIHADCVQLWSLPGSPLQHIFVQYMTAIGNTQGFDMWETADFGATDIEFLNNRAAIRQANCVGVYYAHQLVVSGNQCETLPGSTVGAARLNIQNSPGAVITQNRLGSPIAAPIQ